MKSGTLFHVRNWTLLLVPCLLWNCMPPWQDVCLLSTFLLSHVLFYTLHHVRGMLILSTLVLLLWTKGLFFRWYRSKVLTKEFFKNLLYLVATALMSVAAVVVVWMPLYEAYACVVSRLGKTWEPLAMRWRNTIFLILAFVLAVSAVSQTDLFLRPSQMENTASVKVMRLMVRCLSRVARLFFRQGRSSLRAVGRTMRIICAEFCRENKTPAAFLRAMVGRGKPEDTRPRQRRPKTASAGSGMADQQGEDTMTEDAAEESESRMSSGYLASEPAGSNFSLSDGTSLPSCSYLSQSSSITSRLRSSDTKYSIMDTASESQAGTAWSAASRVSTRASLRSMSEAATRAGSPSVKESACSKSQTRSRTRVPRARHVYAKMAGKSRSVVDFDLDTAPLWDTVQTPSVTSSASEDSCALSINTNLSDKLQSCVEAMPSSSTRPTSSIKDCLSRMWRRSRLPRPTADYSKASYAPSLESESSSLPSSVQSESFTSLPSHRGSRLHSFSESAKLIYAALPKASTSSAGSFEDKSLSGSFSVLLRDSRLPKLAASHSQSPNAHSFISSDDNLLQPADQSESSSSSLDFADQVDKRFYSTVTADLRPSAAQKESTSASLYAPSSSANTLSTTLSEKLRSSIMPDALPRTRSQARVAQLEKRPAQKESGGQSGRPHGHNLRPKSPVAKNPCDLCPDQK